MTESAREELLALLLRDGIFHGSATRQIVGPDGKVARWMLDSLRISMTPRGAELSAECLLDLLSRFESTQLATYGTTGIPFLQSCVMRSQGRYSGILVRKELKAHGSRKLIEGSFDRDRPVVVVDDSIASGSSTGKCIQKLEEAGFRVEGAVCLVRFGWNNGVARLRARGLHVESVFDAYRDFVPVVDGAERVMPANPTKMWPTFTWADDRFPDGLHPAALARLVVERFLRGEPIPRPPLRLDRDYDSAGGAFVSVRSQANVHQRHARDGFWHFPGEEAPSTGEDVVRAALRTAGRMKGPEAGAQLVEGGVAVTFFGRLEEVTVGKLDNDRYGIVVGSRERAGRWGGALPRMPGMAREWAQLEHARRKNAQLWPFEPFVLYRHTVDKAVEPGKAWQPSGVPRDASWHDDPRRGGKIAARAYDLVCAKLGQAPPRTAPLADDLIPAVESIFVTIYDRGRVVGCTGSKPHKLDDDLQRIVGTTLADRRFRASLDATRVPGIAVTVSLLDKAANLGAAPPKEVARLVRHGEQALMVWQGTRNGILLPMVVVQQSLSPEQFVVEVIDKAGITRPPYRWASLDCHTWLADRDGARRLLHGLPEGTPPPTLEAALERHTPLLVGYLLRHHRPDGLRDGLYRPSADKVLAELEFPRQMHGLWSMARAFRTLGDERLGAAARDSLEAMLARTATDADGDVWLDGRKSLMEVAALLLAVCELGASERAAALAATLQRRIDRHGKIDSPELPQTPPRPQQKAKDGKQEARLAESLQDFLPGQVLLALAAAARAGLDVDRAAVDRAFGYYRHRFDHKRSWGQVCWLAQAAAAWWQLTRDPARAQLAFDIADWALEYQLEKNGGFVNEMQPDSPGCSTAVFLEAVAAALGVARASGDDERAARYRASCAAGLQFLDSLVYQERDRPLLPNPERAFGGVRISRTGGDVRIDFVQHALNAVVQMRLALQ